MTFSANGEQVENLKFYRPGNGQQYISNVFWRAQERTAFEQNDTAERMNWTLMEKARYLLNDAYMQKGF